MGSSRYIIGIDLGTTNSALAYIDTLADKPSTTMLAIPQLDGPGSVREQFPLPSSLYVPTAAEKEDPSFRISALSPSLDLGVVGTFARSQGMLVAGRVVNSAKSWLCHSGVDRDQPILPWGSEDLAPSQRVSPVSASAAYLSHFQAAWDAGPGAFHPDYRFSGQEIVITVPASFDEAAQQLTLEAARRAGYPDNVRLLEEPQAAFYHWLESHEPKALRKKLPGLSSVPQLVLICDVGGGTTDFSLFYLSPGKSKALPEIERIAVSDHLLLGGDNIDLAVAHLLEKRMIQSEQRLSGRQWSHLLFQARDLKETVLSGDRAEKEEGFRVSIPGSGSSLFASSLSASIETAELRKLILDGFLPECSGDDRPRRPQGGLKEWGLPFASDSGITRHMAGFVAGRKIDAVLFNGGSLKPEFLRSRLVQLLERWQDGGSVVDLGNPDFDLAVARGAAYYGLALRGQASRIRAGYPRSVYLELQQRKGEQEPKLVCILPKGTEAGSAIKMPGLRFKLLVDQPVRFQPFYSNHRPADAAGDIVELDVNLFQPLPSMQTALASGDTSSKKKALEMPVELESDLNELGLLKLFCVGIDPGRLGRWELHFNLRKEEEEESSKAPPDLGIPPERLTSASALLAKLFGKPSKSDDDLGAAPANLVRELEGIFKLDRGDWSVALLRAIWPALSPGITKRGRSVAHEASWLGLAGFILRPGYGADLDSWRISELWRCFELGLSFPKEGRCQVQWWIMWRRVSGGLDAARQQKVWDKVSPSLRGKSAQPEAFRLAGSLERMAIERKIELADLILSKARKSQAPLDEHEVWALGRLATRVPLYGGAMNVLPPKSVADWSEGLLSIRWRKQDLPIVCSALSQMARVSGDRELDLSHELRLEIGAFMKASGATSHQMRIVREHVAMEESDRAKLLGDSLPAGLKLAE